jgi:hypothetical protein
VAAANPKLKPPGCDFCGAPAGTIPENSTTMIGSLGDIINVCTLEL